VLKRPDEWVLSQGRDMWVPHAGKLGILTEYIHAESKIYHHHGRRYQNHTESNRIINTKKEVES